MNVIQLFAHSEDLHDVSTSNLEHLLTSTPVAVPLYIVCNIAIFYALRNWKKDLVMPFLFGFNLVLGIVSFDTVPAVSIIAITVGITMALLVSLTLLARD